MIYHAASKLVSGINFWKEDNQVFRVIQFGEFIPIMVGIDYTIIDNSLIKVFEALSSSELEIEPVKILRKATNEWWNGYSELLIKEHIDPENIKYADETKGSIWQYFQYIFVSEKLKERLESIAEDQIMFSAGFSHFA